LEARAARRPIPVVSSGGVPFSRSPRTRTASSPWSSDNCWHTNFVADSHGTFEFQFDLAWRPNLAHPQDLAESISTDPILTTNTTIGETPAEHDNLHRR
jgi:hypothetical protein